MTHLSALSLTSFRSYKSQRLGFARGLVVLTGENGAGKTNLLEAISLLAPGRGLRRAKLSEFQRQNGAAPWAVSAELQTSSGDLVIGTGADPSAAQPSDKRVVLVEGQRCPQHDLADYLAISWLTPAMDSLWRDSPGTRRRFLDRLVANLHPAHTGHLSRYEEAMAERNRLLKDGMRDDRWLSSLEHVMATEGMAVAASRRELLHDLAAQLAAPHADLFPRPFLALEGIENWLDDGPALMAEDRLRQALATNRALDASVAATTVGPHRTDLLATHPHKTMPAELCSTGEQKALLISLVLAHAALIGSARGQAPILLLDEVAAHLDETRRNALFSALHALGGQAFLTGADRALFNGLFGRVLCYEIASGQAHESALVPA